MWNETLNKREWPLDENSTAGRRKLAAKKKASGNTGCMKGNVKKPFIVTVLNGSFSRAVTLKSSKLLATFVTTANGRRSALGCLDRIFWAIWILNGVSVESFRVQVFNRHLKGLRFNTVEVLSGRQVVFHWIRRVNCVKSPKENILVEENKHR